MLIAYDKGEPVAAIMPFVPERGEELFFDVPTAYREAVDAGFISKSLAIKEAMAKEEKLRLEAERKAREEAAAPEEKYYDRFADGTDR